MLRFFAVGRSDSAYVGIVYSSRSWNADIGAWQHIETSRSCPVKEMIVRLRRPPGAAHYADT